MHIEKINTSGSNLSKMYFEVKTRLNFVVRTTKAYWRIITTIKHPQVKGKEEQVKKTLLDPDEVRVSKKDKSVFLFYRKYSKIYLCVIVKKQKQNCFIITVYFTKKIKEGELTWKK